VPSRDVTAGEAVFARFMAERMRAATVEIDAGHLSLITHPKR
jgi:hypothetical protein